jgi:hypothetical protein
MENALIMDKARWDSSKYHYFDLYRMLDLILLIDKENEKFYVYKNRYAGNGYFYRETEYSHTMLKTYLYYYQHYLAINIDKIKLD